MLYDHVSNAHMCGIAAMGMAIWWGLSRATWKVSFAVLTPVALWVHCVCCMTVLLPLITVWHCSHGHGPYSGASAGATWRVSFAVLIPVVLWVLYYRVYKLKELQILSSVKKRDGVKGANTTPTTHAVREE